MMAELSGIWIYFVIIVAGWFATDIWRFLGVFISNRIEDDSEILNWIRAVATALVAGLIARLIIFPTGFLADSPVELRIISAMFGFLGYKLAKNSVIIGILVAEVVLVGGWQMLKHI